MYRLKLAGLIMALACAPMSWAGIIYSETVDGDLPVAAATPMTTLNLTSGINTISGNSGITDFDGFGFNVPVGSSLTALSWTYTKNGIVSTYEWEISSGSNIPFSGTVLGTVTLSTPSLAAVPQASGLYSVLDSFGAGIGGFTIDYTFSLEVTPDQQGTGVPEPGTMALVACGLGLAGMARRLRG